MMATYNYTKSPVIVSQLAIEINASGITTGVLTDIQVNGTSLDIMFDNTLSAGDVIILNGVVAAHTGTEAPDDAGDPRPATGDLDMAGYDILDSGTVDGVQLDAPKDSVEIDTEQYHLVGDEDIPGNNMVYGTSPAGDKGWYSKLAASAVDLAAVQRRRTSSVSVPTYWSDISLSTVDVETNDLVVEAPPLYADRIIVKESGLYRISYSGRVSFNTDDNTVNFRVRINDSTVINGSEQSIKTADNSNLNDDEIAVTQVFLVELATNDYVTWQYDASSSGEYLKADAIMTVSRMQGVPGEAGQDGAPGGAGTMIVKDEGTNIPNTPHSAFNWVGSGVTVVDSGAGLATITIPGDGEANTASSLGAGTSVYDGKVGVDLQFRSLVSQNTLLTIVPDMVNNELDFTVNVGNIDHDLLLNFVANEHALPKNSVELDGGQIQLVNDELTPGINQVYGTDGSGVKGWSTPPSPGIVIEVNSSPLSGTPHTIFNFSSDFDIVNIDGDEATIALASTGYGAATGRLNSWTLDTGTTYYQDFAHNLDSDSITYLLREFATDLQVQPQDFDILDDNTVRVYVEGNAEDLQINVVAGGGIGPTGPQGIQGDQGIQGIQGIQGDPGVDGDDGADGANGQGVPAGGTTGQHLVKIDGTDYNTQWAGVPEPGVFGNEYEDHEDETDTGTTSSGSFVVKTQFTTASLPAGNYRIGYSFEGTISSNSVVGEYRVRVGATTDIACPTMEADSDWHQFGGFRKLNLSGAQTIYMEYKSGDGVSYTRMRRARIEIWRVS